MYSNDYHYCKLRDDCHRATMPLVKSISPTLLLYRIRHLRQTASLRWIVSETQLSANDLIYPFLSWKAKSKRLKLP